MLRSAFKGRGSAKERSFIREWAANPRRVAAIAPSSRSLTRIITSEIGPETGPVIELGPGTGVFTAALLGKGVAPQDLALVELNPPFVERLRRRFPQVAVHNHNAAELEALELFGGKPAGAVISGLGLLAMSDDLVDAILGGVFHHLAPGAAMYQFTYGWRCPVHPSIMRRRGLSVTRIGRTFRNLPPASVYKFVKQPAQ